MREHELQFRVRYAETDAMGFVHHSHYFTYFEMGRTELLRAGGGNYREMEAQGCLMVVARLACSFHAPARYDDVLTLQTRISKVGAAKLEHEYKLSRDGLLLAEASSVLACVDRQGTVQRIPDCFLQTAR